MCVLSARPDGGPRHNCVCLGACPMRKWPLEPDASRHPCGTSAFNSESLVTRQSIGERISVTVCGRGRLAQEAAGVAKMFLVGHGFLAGKTRPFPLELGAVHWLVPQVWPGFIWI